METKKTILLIGIVMFLNISCEKPNVTIQTPEMLVSKVWKYEKVEANGKRMTSGNNVFGENGYDVLSGAAAWHYEADYYYEFRNLQIDIPIASGENYQPSIGYWSISDNLFIHNGGMYYEEEYTVIELTENSFIRELTIQVNEGLFQYWNAGDLVTFREYLVPVN